MQVINRGGGGCSLSFGSPVKSPTVSGSENPGCTSSRGPGSLFHCVICQGESTQGGIRRKGKPRRKYKKVWGGVYP